MIQIEVIQQVQLKKILKYHLDQFEKISQWTDLGNWLQKLARQLEMHPTPFLPYKKLLTLYLSKCLSESLPIGIHKTTISIYRIILEQQKGNVDQIAKNIALYSFGLFPFFPKSSIQVKQDLIQLFRDFYLILKIDLIPLLTGLLSCLLPGLEEQDTNIQNLVYKLFEDINKEVGDKYFMSSLWMIMLKNSKNRLNTLKLLNKKFLNYKEMVFSQDLQINEHDNEELKKIKQDIQNTNGQNIGFFPDSTLVLNAISTCIDQGDKIVKKNCLDFVINDIDLYDQNLFQQKDLVNLVVSVLRIMRKNDLGVIKRIFKMLFKQNSASEFEIQEDNQIFVDIFVKAYFKIISIKKCTEDDLKLPFEILQTLHKNSIILFKEVANQTFYELFEFCYNNSFKIENSSNIQIVVEQFDNFLKDYQDYSTEILTSYFNQYKKNDEIVYLYIETFVRIILFKAEIEWNFKIDIISDLMIMSMQFQQKKYDEIQSVNEASFQLFIDFFKDCVLYISQMFDQKKEQEKFDQQILIKVEKVGNIFCGKVEELFQKQLLDFQINQQFQKLFQIMIKLDIIIQQQKENVQEINTFDDLPKYLQLLAQFITYNNVKINYQAIKCLNYLFIEQEKFQVLKKYQNFLYQNQQHYEEGKYCYQLLQKLIDLLEISDYRNLILQFLSRFIQINIKFVIDYLQSLLKSNDAQNFRKISLLWKSTEGRQQDYQLVLQETVFQMIQFIDKDDLLIRNYFKDWFNGTQTNFEIFLITIFKVFLNLTNWEIKDKEFYYTNIFNIDQFIETLKALNIVFEYGNKNFIKYMLDKKLPKEFKNIFENLSQQFKNTSLRIDIKEEQTYLPFLLLLFVRFLMGKFNDQNYPVISEQFDSHKNSLDKLKQKILIFLEHLFSYLDNEELVCKYGIRFIPILTQLLSITIKNSQQMLQLEYLSFLKYFLFKTELPINKKVNEQFKIILQNPEFLNIFLQGIKNEHSFLIYEYCGFLKNLYYLIAKKFKHPILTQQVRIILFFFMESLEERCDQINNKMMEEVIKEQISVLLKGLKECLQFFLKLDKQIIKEDTTNIGDTIVSVFSLGLVQKKHDIQKKITFQIDEVTCNNIINNFGFIFDKLTYCWKDIKIIKDIDILSVYKPKKNYTQEIDEEQMGISKNIIEILQPLYIDFKIKIMEAFLQNWLNQILKINIDNVFDIQKVTSCLKIIEIILNLKIPINDFLNALSQCSQVKKLQNLDRYEQKSQKHCFFLKSRDFCQEVKILSFIYCYLKYGEYQQKNIQDIYHNMLEILKSFQQSQSPMTLCWIIEIINLLIKKFSLVPEQTHKIKQEWNLYMKELFQKIFKIISMENIIMYSQEEHPAPYILPFSPSILQELQTQRQFFGEQNCKNEKDLVLRIKNFRDNDIEAKRMRYFLVQILISFGIDIMDFFFYTQNSTLFYPPKVRPFFERIWNMFRVKKRYNDLILRPCSEFLLQVSLRNPGFWKEYKKEFLELFDRDDFFKMQVDTLKLWSKILDRFLDVTQIELLQDYLEFKSVEDKKRISAFQRICFIIFSGETEKYLDEQKLKKLLKKIQEVLSDSKIHLNLVILILFGIRIILLRLSKRTLDLHFKFLWRWIVFLLEKMINSKKWDITDRNRVTLAALKLLELISYKDIDEFNLHKWAFQIESNLKRFWILIKKQLKRFSRQESFLIPESTKIIFDNDRQINSQIQDKRKIMIDKNQMDDETLKQKTQEFLQYIIELQSNNLPIDQQDLETLIQSDFIEFGEFINL